MKLQEKLIEENSCPTPTRNKKDKLFESKAYWFVSRFVAVKFLLIFAKKM